MEGFPVESAGIAATELDAAGPMAARGIAAAVAVAAFAALSSRSSKMGISARISVNAARNSDSASSLVSVSAHSISLSSSQSRLPSNSFRRSRKPSGVSGTLAAFIAL